MYYYVIVAIEVHLQLSKVLAKSFERPFGNLGLSLTSIARAQSYL